MAAQRAPRLTPEERKRQETVAVYQEIVASIDAYLNPLRDPLAEIDELNAVLAQREAALDQRLAVEREAHRSSKYKADQAAAIARRESSKW